MTETIKLYTDIRLRIDREEVFRRLQITPAAASYESAVREYEELVPELLSMARPKILYRFVGKSAEENVLGLPHGGFYCLMTIGERISGYSSRLFEEGDCLKGMLADAMADSCLFGMEEEAVRLMGRECSKRSIGIAARLEAPGDFPAQRLRKIGDSLQTEIYGITLTSGYMFSPLKTNCVVYEAAADCGRMEARHDCGKCPKKDCMMRKEKRTA